MLILENFKNISRSPYKGRHGSNVIFFFFKFTTKSLEKKKGACRPPTGDRPLSPEGWATGPCRPLGGRQPPFFFFLQGLRCKFEEKNYTLGLSSYGKATGVYF